MKKQLLLSALFLFSAVTWAQAQITSNESKTSRGYLRVGFSNFGKELKNDLSNFSVNGASGVSGDMSILENLREGRYGSERGYVFEFGRNYYFNKTTLLPLFDTKIGLDWTQLSLTYNQLDWSDFAAKDVENGYEVEETSFFAGSASSKLGPVISINFIGKLVVDVRAQLAATYYFNSLNYAAYNDDTDEEKYFTFFPIGDEDEEGFSAITKTGHFGFKQNYGATVRYGGIGLALDYFPGSLKGAYHSSEGDGEEKFKNNIFQIKISLTL